MKAQRSQAAGKHPYYNHESVPKRSTIFFSAISAISAVFYTYVAYDI